MLIVKTKFSGSESLLEPNYDPLKLISVYRSLVASYPIDMPISSARLLTAEVGSTGARVVVLVHSRLTVSYGAAFSI